MVLVSAAYVVVLLIAASIQGRGEDDDDQRPPPRYPWNRSMRDEPYRPGTGKLSQVEAVFVGTANGLHEFHKQAGLDITFATLRGIGLLGMAMAGMGVRYDGGGGIPTATRRHGALRRQSET